jgi:hypothetical protein
MLDFVATQAQAKGAAPSAKREGAQTEAIAAKTPSALPPPTADGVDRMYHQLVEIHAITAAQLAECTRGHRFDPTSSMVQAETGQQGVGAHKTPISYANMSSKCIK